MEIEHLKSELNNELIKDIRIGLSDVIPDTNLYFKEENCICKHSCVIKTLAPSILPVCEEGYEGFEQIFMENQVQKDKLLALYHTDKDNSSCNNNIRDLIIEDFKTLLQTGKYFDVKFELQNNVQFSCHKCILLSRCQYFAMMLSGNWLEKEKTVIPLKGISSNVFQLVINFIYYAEVEIPEEINLSELIVVGDMYNIKGLFKVIQFHFRSQFLHFFHAPCQFCISGSIVVYNILSKINVADYDELLQKLFKWYVTHYCKIFNNRAFSKSSKQLCEAILLKIKESINSVNIIGHFKDCNKLKSSIPNVQWGTRFRRCVEELESYLMSYAADNFAGVTSLPGFMFCLFQDKNVQMNKMLQDMFQEAVRHNISIENCLGIYIRCKEIEKQLKFQQENSTQLQDSEEFVSEILSMSKKFIQRHLMQLQRTAKWKELDSYVKKELKTNSGFIEVDMSGVKKLQIKK